MKKKNNNKKSLQLIITFILAIALVIYSIYAIISLIAKPTNSFLVENGKIAFEESVQGYVIRDEEVVMGENYKNGISQIKAEGEKVANGEAIYRYYTSGEEGLEKKISELDVKIRETMEKENNIYTGDIKTLETQIHKKIYETVELNDLQKIKEYKNELNSSITKKAKIAGEQSPSGSYLKQLIEERSEYENELNSGSEYITATKSGVVSYRIDGLEDVLTTSNLASLNKKMLEDLNLKTGEIVSSSDEAGKVIDNFYCYIACFLDKNSLQAVNAQVGTKIKIRLSNSQEIQTQIEYMVDEDDKTNLVVLKLDKGIEELINYRKISLDIIWWSESGLKIPNDAIKYDGDVPYVTRKRVGYSDDIYVKVLKQNDQYTIIENYTYDELKDLGISEDKLRNRKTISLYDELEV